MPRSSRWSQTSLVGSESGNFNDPADQRLTREAAVRKRRTELIVHRMRVAAFGKLCVTILAGALSGITLWAMTTVTAQLTEVKFESVKKIVSEGRLGAAWALYATWAMIAIGLIAFVILHPRGAPMARGSGIPELKGYLNGNRQQGLFQWRTFAARAIGICLVITATMPFGREGPSVHIGACAASMALNLPWRTYLGWQPSPEERRQILQLGAAAGVAAAFNAPIGGLLYVMEEVATTLPPDYMWRCMITVGMAVGVAQVLFTVVEKQGRIDYSSLVISDPNSSTGWGFRELPLVVVLAVLAGALSAAFTLATDFFFTLRRGKVERAPAFVKKFLASKSGMWVDAVLGALLVASLQVLLPALFACRAQPGTFGVGDPGPARHLLSGIPQKRQFVQYSCGAGQFSEMATLMLQNEEGVVKTLFARDELYTEKLFTPPVVLAFLVYFFFVGSVTFGGAFPAGVFIPNMLMGAALGRLFGFVAELVTPEANKGTYALIGAAAMLGGFTRMTAAVTVIMIEATGVLDVLTPIILACIVARATAGALIGHNLDERMIIAKGVPFLEHEAHPFTATDKVGEALREADKRRGPIIAFRPQERLQVLLNALLLTEHNAFPVLEDVDKNTGFRGLVTRAMLQRVVRVVLEKTDQEETSKKMDVAQAITTKESSFTQRVSATVKGLGLGELFAGVSIGSGGSSSKRRGSKGNIIIDEWSVEGLEPNPKQKPPPPPPPSRRTSAVADDDADSAHDDDARHQGGPSTRSSVERDVATAVEDAPGGRDKSTHAREGEFMSTVARWMNAYTTDSAGSSTPAAAAANGHAKEESVPARVGAAAAAHAAKPATSRSGDDHHYDELKETLVKKIRQGVTHVSNEHLSRMVDLSHALDQVSTLEP